MFPMDLQSLIIQKKSNLKSCKTVVTNTIGQRHEIINGKKNQLESGIPFVIDDKPDLQIAEIIPGLFLSSQDPVVNKELLENHKIGHILSIGIDVDLKFDHIKYHYFDLLDLPESNILSVVEKCIKIIHENRHENVLVHCNAGVSRSPTIVISYLMAFQKLSYDDAIAKVKNGRGCIKPNEGFVRQLKLLEMSK